MSVVTNLILAFSSSENENEIISKLNQFSYNGRTFNFISITDKALPVNWYGGSKTLECCLIIGAYNNFPMEEFVVFVKQSIDWADIETVQIICKEHFDERFKLINIIESI
jgi:hypothetical protein